MLNDIAWTVKRFGWEHNIVEPDVARLFVEILGNLGWDVWDFNYDKDYGEEEEREFREAYKYLYGKDYD